MRNSHLYDSLWYDVIRPNALQRANYKCQDCNAKHHSIGYRDPIGNWVECDEFMLQWCKSKLIKTRKLFLQVAHLDNDPSNNNPINLKVLCPRCHFINDKHIRHVRRISK